LHRYLLLETSLPKALKKEVIIPFPGSLKEEVFHA
jgi:hypothetical protein